jgi:hypothetical protein
MREKVQGKSDYKEASIAGGERACRELEIEECKAPRI